MYRIALCFFFTLLMSLSLKAQLKQEAPTRTDALKLVFETLTLQKPQINGPVDSLLQLGAWEALSYLDTKENPSLDNLREAVPDYYHFFEKEVLIKLIDPQNSNTYSLEAKVKYKLTPNYQINLCKSDCETPSQSWQIIYLDANYMALEMAGLRVFFTHTPPQE